MHFHIDMRTHGTAFGEPVVGTCGDHFPETNGSSWVQTWTPCLTDRDANHHAIYQVFFLSKQRKDITEACAARTQSDSGIGREFLDKM